MALSGGSSVEGQTPGDDETPPGKPRGFIADPLSVYKVLRLRRNFEGGSSLGVMMTGVSRLESTLEYPAEPGPDGKLVTLCPSFDEAGNDIRVPLGQRCFHNAYTGAIDGKLRFSNGDFSVGGQAGATLIHGGPAREQRDGNVIRSGDIAPVLKAALKKEGGGHLRGELNYVARGKQADFNDLGYMQRQNFQALEGWVEYATNGPFSVFNDGSFGAFAWENQTLDFLTVSRGTGAFAGVQMKNTWRVYTEVSFRGDGQDDREVERGASLTRSGGVEFDLGLDSDLREPVSFSLFAAPRAMWNGAVNLYAEGTLRARPLPQLEFDLVPNVTYTRGEPRYWGPSDDGAAYLFGELEAASLSATLSGTYTFLPTLTLQVYGQAFLDFGRYTEFSSYPIVAGARPNILLSDLQPAKVASAADGDFMDGTFNANVVVRWEYRLGSLIYLVYTHAQNQGRTPLLSESGQFDFKLIQPRRAADVFLLKASYWWG